MTGKRKLVIAGSVILAALLIWGVFRHAKTEADDGHDAAGHDEPVAAVARVQRGKIENSLTISGEFKPFQEVDVHAKVAGYIRTIYVDVGDHVKTGQMLAVLEIPELAAELAGADAAVRRAQEEIHRAQGDVERAKSAHVAAHAMYERLNQASQEKSGLVAQQEVDDAQAKDLESEAQVSSTKATLSAAEHTLEVAQANQKQYAALSAYSRISAPFDGVITVRYADTGALIAAGTASSTQSMPVVRLAQEAKLRLVLPIPESLAAQVHVGDPVKVHVQALNDDRVGKVSRFASALDLQTRTMETEIDFENKDGRLYPGMYAQTVLQLAERGNALLVPLEAVTQSQGEAQVLAVSARNIVEIRKVRLGLQGNARVEVLSGLNEGDRVIIGKQSQFRSGEKVAPKEVRLPSVDEGGVN
ncbi:MAG TPA: efflux RND transporter periplasmic adaptor subunit [Candidatus Limnocylindrales bacterium]|nr:efflux RND transporter periplasmic adaptor subunit [Candidatus Limnocylindrales bacterium]